MFVPTGSSCNCLFAISQALVGCPDLLNTWGLARRFRKLRFFRVGFRPNLVNMAIIAQSFRLDSGAVAMLNGAAGHLIPQSRRDMHKLYLADAFDWLAECPPRSIHAIVTDPPYGLKEYSEPEKEKLRNGKGGVWRIPPSFDGCKRSPLPRFTVLDTGDRDALTRFFAKFGRLAERALVPGGHIIIATNPLLSHLVYLPLIEAGLEKRGEIIRLIQTLRGGDRPKNAHDEFADVSVMPRSGWEPWGLFRKPCEGRVQDNLRKWWTGGLRRVSEDEPFLDVIRSAPTRGDERALAPHPSLKPQAFMRQVVRAALPLGKGVILDPFMGAGSTIAAAIAVGYASIGLERDPAYYALAQRAVPALARIALSRTPCAGDSAEGPKSRPHSQGRRTRRTADGRVGGTLL